MPKRPCLICQQLFKPPGSRCLTCQAIYDHDINQARGSATARGYDAAWQRIASEAVARHRRLHGNICPGWHRPAHPADDLTADHIVPRAHGGTNSRDNVQVLCRACNSAKGSADPRQPA